MKYNLKIYKIFYKNNQKKLKIDKFHLQISPRKFNWLKIPKLSEELK